ncbi:MAG: DUF3175 domain-containing protein [Terracidiphilus sp.]|jgi:tRNA(adenine34) deaminase
MIATPRRAKNLDSLPGPIYLPAELFKWTPEAIARSLASREVSPQGPASGMRVLSFYLSHGGKALSASRRRNLEKARKLLAVRVEQSLKIENSSKLPTRS